MTPSQFEPELCAFDLSHAPPGGNVFYGSSSFRLWDDIDRRFPGFPVVNRGFGGSTLEECVAYLPRIIFPLEPATLILYAGDNDLANGASPEHTLHLFHRFVEIVRGDLALIPIAFVSIKPSPVRFWNLANIQRANGLIRDAAAALPGVSFLDIFPQMLGPGGSSRPDLFTGDGLHMNSAGYDIWAAKIRSWLDSMPGRTSS